MALATAMATAVEGPALCLPYDDLAERTALGGAIVDNDQVPVLLDALTADDFYRESHRTVYRAIADLAATARAIDLVTLRHELDRTSHLEAIGGVQALSSLLDGIPRATNVGHYAAIVAEHALARETIRAACKVLEDAQSGDTAAAVLDRAQQALFEVGQRRTRKRGLEPFRAALAEAVEFVARAKAGPAAGADAVNVGYGLSDLDSQTGGMLPGDLVVLAARPGVGKSALALHIAVEAAKRGQRTAVFSVEMGRSQLGLRALSTRAGLDGWRLRTGALSDFDFAQLEGVVLELAGLPLWVDDSAGVTVLDVRTRSRRLKAETGLSLVVVDYLQLMGTLGRVENRQVAVADLSRGLKAIARDLEVPVLCLAQLSRRAEERERPTLSDLRESGAIEQDADTVLFLLRPKMSGDANASETDAEVIVAKQRNGPLGEIAIHFDPTVQRFGDRERRLSDDDAR